MQKTYVQKQNGKAKEQLHDPNCWTNFRVRVLNFDVSVFSLRNDTTNQLGRLVSRHTLIKWLCKRSEGESIKRLFIYFFDRSLFFF